MKHTTRIYSFWFALLFLLASLTGCLNITDTPGATDTDPTVTGTPVGDGSTLSVHFIDVGQADSALVICGGKTLLIDGGNAEDSNLIYAYLEKLNIAHLDYVVCTHAHEDHVGGLPGALTHSSAGVVMAPVTDYNTKVFRNFAEKAIARAGKITVPKVGDSFALGDAAVTVLGPVKDYDDTNNTSIVLRVVFGETSFLFTGDMESKAETDLIESGAILKSTVLKVGHHGSPTSTSYRFLREVAPSYGVISVGKDNSYGHPSDAVLSRLRDADVQLYRTDMQGDIICTSDGKTVSFTTQKNSGVPTNPTEGESSGSDQNAGTEYAYIGNINTKTFHKTTCRNLPKEENRIYFITREEAINAGYTECGVCKP